MRSHARRAGGVGVSARLTVLGASACAPTSLGAAAGYLVEHDGGALLVDCGPGVVARLATTGLLARVTDVIVSHEHADHCGDLTALAYRRAFPVDLAAMPLFAPPGFRGRLEGLDAVFGIPTLPELARPLTAGFDLTEVVPGDTVDVRGLRVATIAADHPVPTLAMRLGGLAYTADTGLSDALVEHCRGADVLLAEATYRDAAGVDVSAHGHLTGRTVGVLAARAGARRLVITHLADPDDGAEILAEARREFAGPVELAYPGLTVEVR